LAGYERLVDGEAAGRVVDDRVEALRLRAPGRGRADGDRGLPRSSRVHGDADLCAELLELLDGGRPVDVRGHEQRPAAALLQAARQLAGHRRLADALQADEHDGGDTAAACQGRVDRPHQGHELLLADLDEVLPRRDAQRPARGVLHPGVDLRSERPLLDPGEEVADDGQVDVRFEQGHADVAQGLGDALVAELANARQALSGRRESPGQGLEHGGGE
jgi:hypothetical protein